MALLHPDGGALRRIAFFGEAVLTPAISVVSAVEGLEVGTSAFKPWVLPLAALVLVALFMFQRQGTAVVGAFFGPVCMLWFIALGAVGIWQIAQTPIVLEAVDPRHAFRFLTSHGFASFVVMGAVLLAFTGAEALYADMGHFGKWPIRVAWFGLVLPALVLNYFGQGALLIANPRRSTTRSTTRFRAGRSIRWSASPLPLRSSLRRRRSPAPTRSRARRSSSAFCRA